MANGGLNISDSKETQLAEILKMANITINDTNPWDMQIHNPKTMKRILSQPSIGLGESYMEGWWDCQQLDGFIERAVVNINPKFVYKSTTIFWFLVKYFFSNLQSIASSKKVAEQHYNVGNTLY